jgi:hypothetical protein
LSSQSLQGLAAIEHVSPVRHLSAEAFRELLRIWLASRKAANQSWTTTSLHLSTWLQVLDGEVTKEVFCERYKSFFNWDALVAINMEPLVAFCYVRMARDAGML